MDQQELGAVLLIWGSTIDGPITADDNASGVNEQGDLNLVLLHWGQLSGFSPASAAVEPPAPLQHLANAPAARASAFAGLPDRREAFAHQSGQEPPSFNALRMHLDDALFAAQEDWLTHVLNHTATSHAV